MKVLVVMPCGETNKSVTTQHIVELMVYSAPIAVFAAVEGTVGNTHNTACQTILDRKEFTHLLFIDSDQTFPFTLLQRLLKHDKDIVGGVYRARHSPHHLFYFPLLEATLGGDKLAKDPGRRTGLAPVSALPSGMMLIKRRVIEKLDYPWFWISYGETGPEHGQSNDINFCYKARAAGFKIYADLDLSREIGHFANIEMGYDKPPTQPREDKLI